MSLWMLKLHRWVALLFALPLAVVILTGLILSFEPWVMTSAIEPASLSVQRVHDLLRQHDPEGRARGVSYRSYDRALTIGAGRGGGTVVDAANGTVRSAPSALTNTFVTARRLHETLLMDAGWLVIASTGAMLAISVIGVLMGVPRIRNTLSGWHKAMGWGLLPLIVLSPLTGLLLAAGVTFSAPPSGFPSAQASREPVRLTEAVRLVGEKHDLSALVWIRPLGGRMVARLVEDGEFRTYAVTRDGVTAMPRNWPRLWHEGNFAGAWSALMNVITSIALTGLLVTGPWIWLRRRLRRRQVRPSRQPVSA